MSNDPRDLSGEKLQKALLLLGQDAELRHELIVWLKQAEEKINYREGSIRDDITGPIVDALHSENDIYEKELIDGTRFEFLFRTKIARDFFLSPQLKPNHVWEPQTTKLLLQLAKERQDDILVGGAYFGDQAILLAQAIKGSGRRLHGFEPNVDQAKMFLRNVGINNLDNVVVQHTGLWSETSVTLKLDGFDSFANAVVAEEGEAGFQTITIDDYIEQNGCRLSLIQMDIEGAELAALKGASRCMATMKPDILFEVHRAYVDWSDGLANAEICKLLIGFGYTLFAIRDFNSHVDMEDRAIELIPAAKVYLTGPPHGFNMLALHDASRLDSERYIIVENVSPKLLAHKDHSLHHPSYGLPSSFQKNSG